MVDFELDSLQKRAEQGDAEAQFYLGVMYYSGNGVELDITQAFELFKKAADQGY
ncbi:MAG: SEL1-like repeat protein, partial [Treponema sp.]|nr:SEL1-like repeat protein [Treponema sp.]